MGRSSRLWDNPLQFNPDRWIENGSFLLFHFLFLTLLMIYCQKEYLKGSHYSNFRSSKVCFFLYLWCLLRCIDPFSLAGPRQCLGMDFAYLEAKLMIVMLLQKFNLQLAFDPSEVIESAGLTMCATNGIPVTLSYP